MNTRFLQAAVCAACTLMIAPPVLAQTDKPFLHPLFSDDAVLQRSRAIPVWGWAKPGDTVTVALDGKTSRATADASGRWMARIGPYPAGGPHTLRVSDANPADTVTRKNILFGDVWLCSGQSNMEFGVGNLADAPAEISGANYPQIRLFSVPKKVSYSPVQTVGSQWLVCSPENIKKGDWNGFSAVGYFFGRKLNQELNIPIGLIHSSWGGTIAEAWVSQSSLGTLPDFKEAIAASERKKNAPNLSVDAQINNRIAEYSKDVKADWATPSGDESGWKTMTLPQNWEQSGIAELADFDGIMLYRRDVSVPPAQAGRDLTLDLGGIDDNDVTYWNGVKVGATDGWQQKRTYTVPGSLVKAGRNVIAIRVTDTGVGGGIYGAASDMKITSGSSAPVPLSGPWKYHIGVPLDKVQDIIGSVDDNNPNQVDVLYNGMIAPLEPFALTGAIWYQGESNANRPEQYARLLPTLINDWRKKFDTPLPFYIVQLAGFMAPDDSPKNDEWPRLRAAQMQAAQTLPNTGIAITTDIGDEKDIHPKNKQDVGLRLALAALAQTYGKKNEYSGPTVKSLTPKNDTLTVAFDHAGGGLTLQGDTSRVFAVAGADGNWFWATPRIDGSRVVLTSPMVAKPVQVRYGWSNLPRATLYNGDKLPAPPFEAKGYD